MTMIDAARAACDGRNVRVAMADTEGKYWYAEGRLLDVHVKHAPDGVTPILEGFVVEVTGGDGHWPDHVGKQIPFLLRDVEHVFEIIVPTWEGGRITGWNPVL